MSESIAVSDLPSQVRLGPTAPSQRIEVIDVLRGLAIFGILMVNMHFFAHPWQAPHLTPDASTLDVVANWIVNGGGSGSRYVGLRHGILLGGHPGARR